MTESEKLHRVFDIAEQLKQALIDAGYAQCDVDVEKSICVYQSKSSFELFRAPVYADVIEVENKKANIPDSFRWAIFERDNFTCQNCGSRRRLTVDHIHPESKGGALTTENAQTLCRSCNSRKGAR